MYTLFTVNFDFAQANDETIAPKTNTESNSNPNLVPKAYLIVAPDYDLLQT